MENNTLPQIIQEQVKDMISIKDTIGRSNASIYHYINQNKELYLKIEKENLEFDHEQRVLKWLQGRLPVPRIITQYKENGYDYLLMTKAKGKISCSNEYLNNPEKLVLLLAEGIKMLQSVDISNCPFDRTLKFKLDIAQERIKDGQIDAYDWEEDTSYNSPEELYEYLVLNQHKEELVFSHGDYCLPNILFDKDMVSGFIDLGRAGIADKWQDIALSVRSLKHNLQDHKYIDLLFEHLDIEPDYEKIKYYILLDELF